MASIDLEKKADLVGAILLDKGVVRAPVMRVGVAIDVSYSMEPLFAVKSGGKSGGFLGFGKSSDTGGISAVQNAFNQLMGVAVKFDDNGELDVFQFDTNCDYVGTSKPETGDYDQFIKNNRIAPRGGTKYAPIIRETMKFFFQGDDTTPVLMLILTDGEPSDPREVEAAMTNATEQPIYFHMVGINGSRSSFPTIAKLADALPNVGEVYLPRLDMSDQEIYSQLICDELIEFVAKFTGPVRAGARG